MLKVIPGTRPENSASSSGVKICPDCGAEILPLEIPMLTRAAFRYPPCECKVKEYQQQEAARQKREQKARLDRLFKNSGLGPRFELCRLDNFEVLKGTEAAHRTAAAYIQNIATAIREGRGFLLFGPPGNGKSHLAAAVTSVAIALGYTAIFERVPKLLAKIRATYRESSTVTEDEIMRALTQADLLVLDDAGAEKWTQWTEPTLYTIVDERYSYNKALIITTNSSLEQLEEKIGARAMDRILEMCDIVENRGESYRKMKAKGRR